MPGSASSLLPTVRTTDSTGGGCTVMAALISAPLLPTPTANLGSNGGPQNPQKRRAGGHSVSLEDAVHLLPTPDATHGRKNTRTSLLLPGVVDLCSAEQPPGPPTSASTGPQSSDTNSHSDDLFHRLGNRDEMENDSAHASGSG